MIDLGEAFFERKQHFFDQLSVHQIIVNPDIQGYPPLFLLCKESIGTEPCEYILGGSFWHVNLLLMRRVPNLPRLKIAERLADAIIKPGKTQTISLPELLGGPLQLHGVDARTRLRKFVSEPSTDKPLYYFQLTHI